ncbi:24409_t:CDS:2, partial [Racocetra persica]
MEDFSKDDVDLTIYFEKITHCKYKRVKIRLGYIKIVDATEDMVDITEDDKARAFTTITFTLDKVLMERSKKEQKQKQLEKWRWAFFLQQAFCSTIEEVESQIVYKFSQNKDMDDKPDVVYLSAKYLLVYLEWNTVEEIWKVSQITSHKINHFIFFLQMVHMVVFVFCSKEKILRDRRLDIPKELSYSGQQFNE